MSIQFNYDLYLLALRREQERAEHDRTGDHQWILMDSDDPFYYHVQCRICGEQRLWDMERNRPF